MVTKTNLATGHPLRRLDCIVLLFLQTLMFSSHVWPFKSNRFKLPFRFLLWTYRVTSGGSVSPDVTWNPNAFGGFTTCTDCTVHNRGLWEWDWRQMRSGTPLPCGISLPPSFLPGEDPRRIPQCGPHQQAVGGPAPRSPY